MAGNWRADLAGPELLQLVRSSGVSFELEHSRNIEVNDLDLKLWRVIRRAKFDDVTRMTDTVPDPGIEVDSFTMQDLLQVA